MSNIRTILGTLILTAACSLKETQKYSLVKTNSQKRSSTKRVKNKKNPKQMKYSSTKPIQSKVKTQFRNKSNI